MTQLICFVFISIIKKICIYITDQFVRFWCKFYSLCLMISIIKVCEQYIIINISWWTLLDVLHRVPDINSLTPGALYMHQRIESALVQIMACRLFGAKPLSKPMLSIGPLGTNFSEISIKIQNFSFMKMHLKISCAKWRPFCPGGQTLTYVVHSPAVVICVNLHMSSLNSSIFMAGMWTLYHLHWYDEYYLQILSNVLGVSTMVVMFDRWHF